MEKSRSEEMKRNVNEKAKEEEIFTAVYMLTYNNGLHFIVLSFRVICCGIFRK